MSDATFKDFQELAGEVVRTGAFGGKIMPKPHWGQDAAMLGFFIDGLREKSADAALLATALQRLLVKGERFFNAPMVNDLHEDERAALNRYVKPGCPEPHGRDLVFVQGFGWRCTVCGYHQSEEPVL
jgi:hypothetical protein